MTKQTMKNNNSSKRFNIEDTITKEAKKSKNEDCDGVKIDKHVLPAENKETHEVDLSEDRFTIMVNGEKVERPEPNEFMKWKNIDKQLVNSMEFQLAEVPINLQEKVWGKIKFEHLKKVRMGKKIEYTANALKENGKLEQMKNGHESFGWPVNKNTIQPSLEWMEEMFDQVNAVSSFPTAFSQVKMINAMKEKALTTNEHKKLIQSIQNESWFKALINENPHNNIPIITIIFELREKAAPSYDTKQRLRKKVNNYHTFNGKNSNGKPISIEEWLEPLYSLIDSCDYADERQMECVLFKLPHECKEWYQRKLDESAQDKAIMHSLGVNRCAKDRHNMLRTYR
eukprot:Pgem_evm1s19051